MRLHVGNGRVELLAYATGQEVVPSSEVSVEYG